MAVGRWFKANLLQLPTLLVAVITLLGVNSLSNRLSTSELITRQIDNLKKGDDIDRNLSILAIEHTLSSRSPVERVHHNLLLNRLLAELLHNDQVKGRPLSEGSGLSRQRLAHIVRIMEETIDDLSPACGRLLRTLPDARVSEDDQLEFETAEASSERIRQVADDPACRRAALFGFWRGPWPGRTTSDELLSSTVTSYLAIDQRWDRAAEEPAEGVVSSKLETLYREEKVRDRGDEVDLSTLTPRQKQAASALLNSAVRRDQQKNSVAERNNLSSSLPHVFIHYNHRADDGAVKEMARRIADHSSRPSADSKFFVDKTLRFITPRPEACANGSHVKYFHTDDAPAAAALLEVANGLLAEGVGNGDLQPLQPLPDVGLVDLSRWKLSAKVPRGQLELWLMDRRQPCGNES